ncbi:MAG TPA: hypothetical protein VIT42_10835, partial [Microlunatus sp.]
MGTHHEIDRHAVRVGPGARLRAVGEPGIVQRGGQVRDRGQQIGVERQVRIGRRRGGVDTDVDVTDAQVNGLSANQD